MMMQDMIMLCLLLALNGTDPFPSSGAVAKEMRANVILLLWLYHIKGQCSSYFMEILILIGYKDGKLIDYITPL